MWLWIKASFENLLIFRFVFGLPSSILAKMETTINLEIFVWNTSELSWPFASFGLVRRTWRWGNTPHVWVSNIYCNIIWIYEATGGTTSTAALFANQISHEYKPKICNNQEAVLFQHSMVPTLKYLGGHIGNSTDLCCFQVTGSVALTSIRATFRVGHLGGGWTPKGNTTGTSPAVERLTYLKKYTSSTWNKGKPGWTMNLWDGT